MAAGFILGADGDTEGSFDAHIEFVQTAGVVMAMEGLLTVLKETGLYKRLEQEGRLLNQFTRHWYSTKHCERAQTVRSERSRASGNVEERDYSWLRAFDCAALRSGRTERVATRSEEVYESSVV